MNIWLKKIETYNNEVLLKTYEKKVISLTLTQESLEEKLNNSQQDNFQFDKALERVLSFMQNPHETWKNGQLKDRLLVQKLVFTKPLEYSLNHGFGTPEYSLPIKLFSYSVSEKSCLVEMRGIEPLSKNL